MLLLLLLAAVGTQQHRRGTAAGSVVHGIESLLHDCHVLFLLIRVDSSSRIVVGTLTMVALLVLLRSLYWFFVGIIIIIITVPYSFVRHACT